MVFLLRRLLFGSPLPTWRMAHERLPKVLALPIFASDALSSVAYATEEILLALIIAGTAALSHSLPVAIAIVALLAIVATSYRQTIFAYPSGGGSYVVAKENLGDGAGLTAGAALMIDYTLTVAVSVAAGVAAITSFLPAWHPYRVHLGIVAVGLITLANMRGVRESGLLFALPTYTFVASALALVAVGIYRLIQNPALTIPPPPGAIPPITHGITLFLILRAFSGGCAAMTGTEAISNGVPAFRPPEARNAAATLAWMALLLGVIFLGVSYIAWRTHVVPINPDVPGYQTVVSQIARVMFGRSWLYYLLQIATALILILAANTSFAGFPRLASIMARDRYLPRQLYNLGDRLVFSNGILLLALLASVLIAVFHGETHALIPLYAVGVFLSFTLSQAGMVRHSVRLRTPGWRRSAVISAVGAISTAVVTLVIASTKFILGAWIVVLLIPCFVYLFMKIHGHYVELGDELRLMPEDRFVPTSNTVLVLTPSLHKGILPALEYAKGLSSDVRAVHIDTDPLDSSLLEERWETWGGGIPLVVLESPYRSLAGPLLEYLEEVKREKPNNVVTVIIPEFVAPKWWHRLLHNQSGLMLKFRLLFVPDVVTTNVRYYVGRR